MSVSLELASLKPLKLVRQQDKPRLPPLSWPAQANVQRLRRSEASRAAITGKLTLAWRIADLKVNDPVSLSPEFAAQLAFYLCGFPLAFGASD